MGRIENYFSVTRTTTAKGSTRQEVAYYISSLPCKPEDLLATSCSLWRVESMHWMLDVIWHENNSGILSDNGNKTMNSFRKLSLLAHKRYIAGLAKEIGVKGNVLSSRLNHDILFKLIQCL